MFLIDNGWFRSILIGTDVWKEFGYNAVIYVAAMTSIDPTLYEAGDIDGANRWQKIVHITLPAILPTIVLMTTLNMGQVLNAGFDQVYNMYSPWSIVLEILLTPMSIVLVWKTSSTVWLLL